ncbi:MULTISPECIES: lysozyme inhibitor LprI family protein [unclassified Pseudomonas]|uniref:lysozyme inhibitor LprI family protein n=1 Tax=unclassified Pseudomonas TaxID=196821 RepID=UPI001F5627C9|nr:MULTISPECIES: lysozyme inhibitor LprI family protein [unclassified Pseudomonas]
MNRKTLLVPFAAGAMLLALCGSASAAENAALKKCMDSANTTVDMVNCNAKEAKVQDERVNKAYKTALAAQEGDRKEKLQDVQRLWIKYRDANCGFAGSATGGTIDQVNGSGCLLDMTQTRAQELEDLVGP